MRPLFLFLLASITLVSCKQKSSTPNKPNILFIMSDDHTSQAWGIYGGILEDYVHTPNISRLADEGAVLNNSFCTNSICVPSRATILTGQYSHNNGVYTLSDALTPERNNIAKVLNNNGYQTAIIGKWHLKKEPSGFDYYNILHDQGRYWDPILRTKENFHKKLKDWDVHKGFSTDVIADLSMNWLDTIDSSKPFMLMTHFKATHEPFDFPERFNDLYKNQEIPEPASLLDFSPETTGRSIKGQKLEQLAWRYEQASNDPDKWWCKYPGLPFYTNEMDSVSARKAVYQKFVKDFMRSGAAIDDNIGKLLDYLEEKGIADNTIVIYTADQGYFLGEHGFFDKRLIYEESLRMPFVIRYPKEIEGGKRIDDIILNIDFPSLMADYAGVQLQESFQGTSFRENLKGNTPNTWRKNAYYRYWTNHANRPAHFGIRNERYKLALFYGHSLDMTGSAKEATKPAWEFYDLEKDPKENTNAYNNPEYDEIIKEMKVSLKELKSEIGDSDSQYPEMQTIFSNYWHAE
ncbi:sulfatase family protein [Urechidicola vernalis]|uniref:Sulfatase n=1 Tax=Urechidicola vernalis TaxID=3075600 RepID=A0ABU2Y398_9FLAO|nr:sulfatase [Urechidicola sp. P050]MDT0552683.1 sulfatase [Urechidicola sp. P050]